MVDISRLSRFGNCPNDGIPLEPFWNSRIDVIFKKTKGIKRKVGEVRVRESWLKCPECEWRTETREVEY